MERKNTKELLPIITAFAEGKEIQFFHRGAWNDVPSPKFDEEPYLYRIKPEPKYRPFKSREECWNEMKKHQPFCWVKCIKTENFEQITYVGPSIVSMSDTNPYFSTAFDKYKFADGTPFGIKE